MRVLSIVSDLGPGGTQRIAVDVAKLYRNAGFESAVLTRLGGGPRLADLETAGVKTFLAPDRAKALASTSNFAARDWKPDLIHFHRSGHAIPSEGQLVRMLRDDRETEVRVIEHSHFGRADRSDDRHLFDVHIEISLWCLWTWTMWNRGLQPPPLGVHIPHMVDASRFEPASEEEVRSFKHCHRIPENAFVYGFLAQPDPARWSPVLFESFAEVAKDDPEAYLVIAGIDDSFRGLYTSLPESIRSRIVELPFIQADDTLKLVYSAMDVFVHTPLTGETFGLILAESMCCHTPVVTMANPARGNAQAEVVGNERGGLVAAHAGKVVQAMKRLRNDPDLRKRCARRGRRSVIERYNSERVGGMLLALARHVLQSRDRSDLRVRLDTDPLFRTSISERELLSESGGMIGDYTLQQRLLKKAVMSPLCQHLLARVKHRKLK